MLSFSQFLVEGGNATKAWSTERANSRDITKALKIVSTATGISFNSLKQQLIGSTELTLLGKKKDSGDIDIALSREEIDPLEVHKKMLEATNQRGDYNRGTQVGSYAVDVSINDGGGKLVQVDLMFVGNKEWAKFIYHSSQGNGSQYSGAVRNILMFTALTKRQKPGKDFVHKGEDGRTLARASMSIKMDSGMERLFKTVKPKKTGGYTKTLQNVTPEEVKDFLKTIGKQIDFDSSSEKTNDPKKVVEFIFGKGVSPEDVKTAEGVIKLIKKQKDSKEIINACISELTRLNMEVPVELN